MSLSIFGAEATRVVLSGHVPVVVPKLSAVERLPATNELSLALGLPLRNRDELEELLHQLYDPATTNYHKFLNLKEFTDRFGPTEDAYLVVRRFAESHGLTVIGTHPNRLVLDVCGPVAGVEKAFGVSLHRYRHPTEARTFFAPYTEPSVPTNVPVADLWGLTDYGLPTPLAHQVQAARISPLNYNGTGPSGSFQGRDFRNAYASGSPLVGLGQVAAVAEFDGYFSTDITNYEFRCGYTNVPLTNILLDGVSGTPGYSGVANAVAEVSLDIELIIAMAPGLSRLAVYEGENPYTVFSQIASDNTAKQISCSWAWGVGPSYWLLETPGSTLDSLLSEMAAQGQSVFQASGDSDADTGSQSVNASTGPLPVDSIYLTSVGGTSLTTSSAGAAWSSEKVWNRGGNEGSSGGISSNYTIPYWQTNVSMSANGGSTKYRNFPDVALTADAVEVIYSNGISAIFGGTSCAAPLWAGFTALVNQQAVGYGRTNVGFLNPALYAIADSINYTNCFHDVTNGNNIGTHTAGLFYAVTNYDLATGLGSPAGTNLINALAPPNFPIFAVQPSSQTATYGATVTFGTIAEGQSPLSYRWLCNGTNLAAGGSVSGATTNTLTLTAVTLASAGSYALVVSNTYGAVTSSVASLTVTYPPSFTTEPTNQSVVVGGAAQFTAAVAGGVPLAYQWRQNGTNLVAGGNLSGVATNVLTLSGVAAASAGSYTLVVTNIFGAATSSAAVLTVWEPAAITTAPVAQTIQCGSNASFTVTATGNAPLLYQWSLDGSTISGATNTSLALVDVRLPSHTVAVVVTNLYGSATSSVSLTMEDTLPPAITLNSTNPYYVELDNSYVEPGATAYDLCAGTVAVTTTGTVNTAAVSTNTVTYTANDGNGNTNTATRTVMVRDTTPPTMVWSFTNLVLAANSNCEAIMPNVTGTNYLIATDASGALTITQTPTNHAPLPLGTNLVVITMADAAGNKSYSTNNIMVADQTPPVITVLGANPFTLQLGSTFTDPGVTAADTCSSIAWLQTNGTVNVNAVGTNLLTYLAVDGAGNTNSATRTVSVQDTTPPTILWSFTNLVLAANSNCEAVMPNMTGTNGLLATDLSGVASVTQTPTNGAILPLGTNQVIFAVADPYRNTAYSTNQVVVQDVTPPTITLPGANPFFVELGTVYTGPGATAVDACSGVALLVTNGTVNTNVVGTNLLTYLAVDGAGNTNSATRTVIVRDTMPPTILWSFTNLVLAANSNCEAVMPDVTGTNGILATDLSGVASVTQTPTNGAILPLGTNLVTLAVADSFGNTANSTNQVVVVDQTPPVLTVLGANPVIVQLGTTFSDPGVTAMDSCSGIAWLQTNGTVNVNVVGANLLTYIAVDGAGNTNSATRTVIVGDTTPPTILWSFTNLVLAANSNCEAVMPNLTGTNGLLATDLSGVVSVTQVPTNGAVLPLGTNQLIFKVTDPFGNVADSTNQVVVEDQTPPVITVLGANPFTLQLGTTFTDPGMTAADTCSGIASLQTNGSVNVNAVGTNLLTYVAVDGANNTNSSTRTVIVQDTTPPTILWSFTNLVLAANSNCEAVMPIVTGTNGVLVTDLVAVATIVQNPTNGAVLLLGTNVVVITVTDPYGNVADSTNQVVVEDQTPPVITVLGANPFTLQLGTAFTDPGVTVADTCSGFAWLQTNGAVNVNAVGMNLLTYLAVDGAGNTNSAARTVIVRDTIPPTILWSFTNLVLAANSNCEAVMPNVTGTNEVLATDLSGVALVTQVPTNGAILPLGTNIVILAVADPYGNTTYSTNQMVVEDQAPPVIWTQPQGQTNVLGATASFSVVATACTPISYQWLFEGVGLTAQTNASLVLSNLALGAAGSYAVAVTAAGGSVTSAVAFLAVTSPPTALSLVSSANPDGFKDRLTFTADVTPVGTTGTIQFLTNGTVFDTEVLAGGTATSIALAVLPRGANTVTALYPGDGTYLPATNSIAQTVTNHPPVVTPAYFTIPAGQTLTIPVTNLATHWSDVDGDTLTIAWISPSTNGVVVTNALPALYYASTNYVNDLFVCAITDGWGGTNNQTVYITVLPQTNSTPKIAVTAARSSVATLQLGGASGATYVLEYATNLVSRTWTPLATNVLNPTGTWQYTDNQVAGQPRRFFRLQLVTP